MKIETINDTPFLTLDTLGEQKLNPFLANINHIRYIREYAFDTDEENGYAVFVGEKMLVTKQTLVTDETVELSQINIGDSFTLGNVKFQCRLGGGLNEDTKSKYYINMDNAYHIRQYINGRGENKQLAIITVDGRVIPVDAL